MQLTPEEVLQLQHRPLFNLLAQVITSVGQPIPTYYMQQPDGQMVNVLDGGNACAAYVSRMLAAMGVINGQRLIDGPHATVAATLAALKQAGWQAVPQNEPLRPGDILHWIAQQQVDGVHAHLGFALANEEAASTSFTTLLIGRHHTDFNGQRPVELTLRYGWSQTEYDALAHLDFATGTAR